MKAVIIYDSVYGNTEQIAKAIAGAFNSGDIKILKVREASYEDIEQASMVILGSPTNGGKMTADLRVFVGKIPNAFVTGKKVALFDTRLKTKLVTIFGYAAPKLAEIFRGKGAELAAKPEGFLVKATKGPLVEGELERAAAWAKTLNSNP